MPSKRKLTVEKVNKILEEINEISKKHDNSWEVFFHTLAEQVWNVPNLVPMMNIEREIEFAEGLYADVSNSCCIYT